MKTEKQPLLILTGPTAVGKTDLSIALAKRINGAVISADSMQVYRGMDIGSAKVMPEEMQGVDHYLIDYTILILPNRKKMRIFENVMQRLPENREMKCCMRC